MSRVAAVILAAGGSRRLGRPKQLVRVDGVPLVRRAALAAIISARNVRRLLRAGVTSFLDADCIFDIGVDLRDAIDSGVILVGEDYLEVRRPAPRVGCLRERS